MFGSNLESSADILASLHRARAISTSFEIVFKFSHEYASVKTFENTEWRSDAEINEDRSKSKRLCSYIPSVTNIVLRGARWRMSKASLISIYRSCDLDESSRNSREDGWRISISVYSSPPESIERNSVTSCTTRSCSSPRIAAIRFGEEEFEPIKFTPDGVCLATTTCPRTWRMVFRCGERLIRCEYTWSYISRSLSDGFSLQGIVEPGKTSKKTDWIKTVIPKSSDREH